MIHNKLDITCIMLYGLLNKLPLGISCNKIKVKKFNMNQLLSWLRGVSCFCCELNFTVAPDMFFLPFDPIKCMKLSWPASCQPLLPSPTFSPAVHQFSCDLRIPTHMLFQPSLLSCVTPRRQVDSVS